MSDEQMNVLDATYSFLGAARVDFEALERRVGETVIGCDGRPVTRESLCSWA